MALILRDKKNNWSNGEIPFKIVEKDFTTTALKNIFKAIEHWETQTNWKIFPRTNQKDYVVFKNGGECKSWVGRKGGEQSITLSNTCGLAASIHEIGHCVGFKHEHTRNDRDNYVAVMLDRVRPEKIGNFKIVSLDVYKDFGEYDYESIMHYSESSFRKVKRYEYRKDWTISEFYNVNGQTYLFLLRKSTGEVHINRMKYQFIGREIERYLWSSGWTNAEFYKINRKTYLFLLKKGTGDYHIHKMNIDGTVGGEVDRNVWSSGWTSSKFYKINGQTYLFLLKKGTGDYHIHKMNDDGTVGREVDRNVWSSGWTNVEFYTINRQTYLFLLKKGTGDVHIHEMKNDGTVGREVDSKLWSSGWTNTELYATNGQTYLFLLKKGTGDVHIHEIKNDGTVGREVDSKLWSSGWTNTELYTVNGVVNLFLLKSASGDVHIHEIKNTGKVGDEYKVQPELNIFSPYPIGQGIVLSPTDIEAANSLV